MLLADLVATADTVASTSSRLNKTAAMAELLRRLGPDEIEPATGFFAGWPRQGKIGVGWAQVFRLEVVHASAPSLTIADLDKTLSALQATTGAGSVGVRASLLSSLLGRATEAEASFVRRLLVGELRQGALESLVADAVAKAAGVPSAVFRRALMLSGDLGRTSVAALTGGLEEIGLTVMRPVQPMLASPADDIAAAVGAASSVEWKLDGIRVQVHRAGEDVAVYTRNLNDITGRVPEIVAITQSLKVESVVLDGEAIGMDEAQRPHAFQRIASRIGRHGPGQMAVVPFFFDVLHVDGRDLIDEPLRVRRAELERIAPDWCMPAVVTSSPDEAGAFLSTALDAGHEGIVAKDLESTYQAGRRGKTWRKVKPVKTFDLVVLAVEWGHGRRTGLLSNLHLGARDGDEFVMVGKTFKGLTDQLLAWQTERFQALQTRADDWTVHVRPEQVVEIELDGVQTSTRYPGGIALRFARVVRYRDDKPAHEADTLESLRELLR